MAALLAPSGQAKHMAPKIACGHFLFQHGQLTAFVTYREKLQPLGMV